MSLVKPTFQVVLAFIVLLFQIIGIQSSHPLCQMDGVCRHVSLYQVTSLAGLIITLVCTIWGATLYVFMSMISHQKLVCSDRIYSGASK